MNTAAEAKSTKKAAAVKKPAEKPTAEKKPARINVDGLVRQLLAEGKSDQEITKAATKAMAGRGDDAWIARRVHRKLVGWKNDLGLSKKPKTSAKKKAVVSTDPQPKKNGKREVIQ
jgi:hypothetical protein